MATNLSVREPVQAVHGADVNVEYPRQRSAPEAVEVRRDVRERQLLVQQVRFDEQARNARLEEIKAQVNAETYQIDALAIASCMLQAPQTRNMLGIKTWDHQQQHQDKNQTS